MQGLSTQRGGTILGFILGVVVGLGIAFGVAVYVSKLPMPFLKGGDGQRPATGASARGDINSPLGGKAPLPAPTAPQTAPAAPAASAAPAPAAPPAPAAAPGAQTSPVTAPAVSADPLGDLAQAQLKAEAAKQAAQASSAGVNYFVQVGAFRNRADAEAQRAKLAMLNLQARVSEREQNGLPMFRVRLGPFAERADAEQTQRNLRDAGMDASLVRVQP